jgi:hypothetical protein
MQSRDAGLTLPGVPDGECGTRGRVAAATPPTAQGLAEIGVEENEIGLRCACFSVSKAQDGQPRNIPKVADI